MGLEDAKLKTTLSEPTDASKTLDTKFTTSLRNKGVNPHVIKEDEKLHEDDKTLKVQIWDLDKMEALVYGDPKLNALYDKLAVTGKETYGYHWNETLMNLIFNQFVLHSPKYLQKYKQAQPKEKKRRDTSGNKKLKATIQKEKGIAPAEEQPAAVKAEGFDIERDGVRRTEKKYDTMQEPIEDKVEETTGAAASGAFTPQLEGESKIDETTTSASSGQYAGPSAWSKNGKPASRSPLWKGGQILESAMQSGDYLTDPTAMREYYKSLNEGLTSPNDDSRVPIAEIGGMFSNAVSSKNNVAQILAKNKDLFKKLKTLPAGSDDAGLVNNFTQLVSKIKGMGGLGTLINNAEDRRYAEFLVSLLANYSVLVDRGLDQQPQVAGLLKDIKAVIDPAMLKSLGEGAEMNEHHLGSRDEKINFILQNSDKAFNRPSPTLQQELTAMSDEDIEVLYLSIEKAMETAAPAQAGVTTEGVIDETVVPQTVERFTKMEQYIGIDDLLDNIFRKLDDSQANEILSQIEQDFNLNETVIPQTYERLDKVKNAIGGSELLDSIMKKLDDMILSNILDELEREFEINTVHEGNQLDEIVQNNRYEQVVTLDGEDAIEPLQILKQRGKDAAIEYLINWHQPGTHITSPTIEASPNKAAKGGYVLTWDNGHVSLQYDTKADVKESMIDQQDPSMVNGNPSSMVKPDAGGDAVASSSSSSSTDSMSSLGEAANALAKFGKAKNDPKGVQGDNKFKKGVNEPNVKRTIKDSGNKLKDFGDETTEKAKDEKVNTPIVGLKESLTKELDFYASHLNALNDMMNEDRRPSALVNLDRLKKDNEKNFKADIKNNNIEDEVNMQNELMADDLTVEVGENPYKLGQEIEKKALAKTNGGQALKNVGNSDNSKGDEIPKRNLTKDEMTQVALNRGKGLQDIVYDNEPSKRFEERMKQDMGEDIYKIRQDKMKYNANAPMYNKDTQPMEKGEKALQFDKDREGYNSPKGLGESISAKYFDEFGKKKFVDFKINETVEIATTDDTYILLNTDGMGNSYTTKVNENTAYNDFAAKYNFYLKEGVVYVTTKKNTLNESTEAKPKADLSKINHLIGYKPSTFVDSKKSKKII